MDIIYKLIKMYRIKLLLILNKILGWIPSIFQMAWEILFIIGLNEIFAFRKEIDIYVNFYFGFYFIFNYQFYRLFSNSKYEQFIFMSD